LLAFSEVAERFSDSGKIERLEPTNSAARHGPTTTTDNIGLTPFRNCFSDAVSIQSLAQTLIVEEF